MDKEQLKQITLGLYKVTEIFPDREPVKFFLREKASKTLADAVLFFEKNPIKLSEKQKSEIGEEIIKNISLIQVYFDVSKHQGWADSRNFLVLGKEYQKIRDEVERQRKPHGFVQAMTGKVVEEAEPAFDNFRSERTKKIMEFLKKKDRVQIWELKEVFPEVTKRTLRRDFEYLLANNLVEREGDGKYTFYKVKTIEDNRTNYFE